MKNTHLVLKWEWIDKLDTQDRGMFNALLRKIIKGKEQHNYYVVNFDEPYADLIKRTISIGEANKVLRNLFKNVSSDLTKTSVDMSEFGEDNNI